MSRTWNLRIKQLDVAMEGRAQAQKRRSSLHTMDAESLETAGAAPTQAYLEQPSSHVSERADQLGSTDDGRKLSAPKAAAIVRRPPSSAGAMLDISTFLRSIQAGVTIQQDRASAPWSDKKAASSNATAMPALPISATRDLISAQIENVQNSMRGTIQQRLEEFRRQAHQAKALPLRIEELQSRVLEVRSKIRQQGLRAGMEQIPDGEIALSEKTTQAATRHAAVLNKVQQSRSLMQLAERLLPALEATEAIELDLAHGRLHQAHTSSLPRAKEALKLVTSSIGVSGTGDEQKKADADWSWLMDPAPKGLREARVLRGRVILAEETAEALLHEAWARAVQIRKGGVEVFRSVHAAWVSGAAPAQESPQQEEGTTLRTLLLLLESKNQLDGKLSALIEELRSKILHDLEPTLPLSSTTLSSLASVAGTHPEASEDLKVNGSNAVTFAMNLSTRSPAELAHQLVSLVIFLTSPTGSPLAEECNDWAVSQRVSGFRAQVINVTMPIIAQLLERALPTTLSAEELQKSLQSVEQVAQTALELFDQLIDAGFSNKCGRTGDLDEAPANNIDDDDDDPSNPHILLRFAKHAKQRYFKRALQVALHEVREKLLEDNWAVTQVVELRHSIPIPVLQKEPEPYTPFVNASEETPTPPSGLSSTTLGLEPAQVAAANKQGRPSALQPAPTALIGRVAATATSRMKSSSDDGAAAAAIAAGASKKPKGKAALGAARIVKPKDQLGSGPWDLDGSGLDDLVRPAAEVASQTPVVPDAAEDDAWDLDEGVPVLAQVFSPSPVHHSNSASSGQEHPAAANDEDDAWFGDDDAVPEPTTALAPVSASAAAATHTTPNASFDEAEIDDGAWGLSEEEIAAKRASRLGIPTGFDLQAFAKQEGLPSLLQEPRPASEPTPPPEIGAQSENDPAPPSTTPSLQAASVYSTSRPSLELMQEEEIDDDAWGLSSEEIAARRASRIGLAVGLDFSKVQQTPVLNVWQEDVDAPSEVQSSYPAPAADPAEDRVPSSAVHPHAEKEDIDDDAWGLSEEEIAKRASMLGQPIGFDINKFAKTEGLQRIAEQDASEAQRAVAPTTRTTGQGTAENAISDSIPPALSASGSHALAEEPLHESLAESLAASAPQPVQPADPENVDEDDIDDDAWGLSAAEIAAKRASMLGMPADFDIKAVHEQQLQSITTPPSAVILEPTIATLSASSLVIESGKLGFHNDDAWDLSAAEAVAKKESQILPLQELGPSAGNAPDQIQHAQPNDTDLGATALAATHAASRQAEELSGEQNGARTASSTDAIEQIVPVAEPRSEASAVHSAPATEPQAEAGVADAPAAASSAGPDVEVGIVDALAEYSRDNFSSLDDKPQDAQFDVTSAPVFPVINRSAPDEATSAISADSHDGHLRNKTRAVAASASIKPTPPKALHTDAQMEDTKPLQREPLIDQGGSAPATIPRRQVIHEHQGRESGEAASRSVTPPVQPADVDNDAWDVAPPLAPTAEPGTPLAKDNDMHGSSPLQQSAPNGQRSSNQSASVRALESLPVEEDDTEAWGWDDDADAPHGGAEAAHTTEDPSVIAEKCSVSQRTIDLLQHVESLLELVGFIADELSAQSWKTRPADMLLEAALDEIDLHNGIMPSTHSEVLTSVPSLAIQFANDCSFIAQQLQILHEKITVDLQEKASAEFHKRAALTNLLGKQCFEAQMVAQETILEQSLAEADGFSGTNDPSRYALAERAVKQVLHVLRTLAATWSRIMTRTAFLAAMGRLIDGVLLRLLEYIEDLEDISEVESDKLAVLCKMFGPLEEIFVDESTQQTSVALFVPSWFKASYLSEILTGSLVDIEFLFFEAGALVDYSKAELSKLIKALFSDSSNRAKLLHHIEVA
ncbi:hypothetical protein K437DRAFT_293689 [Tilletiaria anomala UBC 951]|uniref:Retrograde transport protein Dsl1 C-terminal domain-containing protein n=1 Tax=Tilletiaria anomala (strain ATCC 24038 / CBS 436.72 / UBC 951) TaxID=1037660 RepID=A0A066W739_TILAU|nr:uncharacterized protein K437DRAFT_293689 [Tilletiaria anomala UBC 951]KDN49566.1 hypothetical protein K437DRAFT_293689 [Tilletiaria anomala UBC 951]